MQTFELRHRNSCLHAVQVLAVVQAVVGQDVGGSGIVRSCLAEEGGVGSGDRGTLILTFGETLLVSRVRDWKESGGESMSMMGESRIGVSGMSSSSSSRFGEVR